MEAQTIDPKAAAEPEKKSYGFLIAVTWCAATISLGLALTSVFVLDLSALQIEHFLFGE